MVATGMLPGRVSAKVLGLSGMCCRQDGAKDEEAKGRASEIKEAAESAAESSDEEEGDEEGAEEERPLAKDWEVEPIKLHEGFTPAVQDSGAAGPAPGPAPSQAATERQAKLAEALASDEEKDETGKAVHKVGEFR